MKASVMLFSIALVVSALAGPTPTSDVGEPNVTLVKLYTGVPGSNDYIWGYAPESRPTDAWAFHSELAARMMDNACASNANYNFAAAGYSTGRVFYRNAVGTMTWSTMTQCPLDLCTGGAAIIGDTFYYCGGYKAGMTEAADTLYKYSISGNSWTSGPGPFAGTGYNWSPTIAACAGKLYFMSGCAAPGATNPSRQVWQYTPGAGWVQVASLNLGRVFAHAVAYHDTIWMAGGNTNNAGQTHTEFYDPVADTWIVNNTVFPQLPDDCWAGAAGIAGNKMFIAAGVKNGAISNANYLFDFASRTWSTEAGMPLAVYRTAGCGTADGKALVCGGSTGGFTPTDTVQYNQYSTGNANDVGVSQILIPPAVVTPGNYTPRAQIQNFGTDPQSAIPVYCWIDSSGTRVYNQNATYAGPLAPGATANVDFPAQWRAVGGTYNVTMFTAQAGDENRLNDTLRGNSQVMLYTIDWYQSDTIRPDRVSRVVCASHDGKLHVINGNCFIHTSHPYDQVYDTTANTWSQGLGHPAGSLGLHNHDLAQVNDVIWVGGGSSGSGYYNNLTKLDLGANTWTSAVAMPQTNLLYYSMGSYPDSGWVYCFGGAPSGGTPINNAYKYNPVSNTWSAIANMPAARRNPMVATVGDTIYVIGGMQLGDYTSTRGTVWKYSVLGNTWTAATDTMPDALGWGKAVVYDDGAFGERIYVIGGYRRGTIVNACWRYDVSSGSWTADRNLLITNRSHGVSIEGNYIWVAGGFNTVILPNVIKGIIYRTGIEEGKPSIAWSEVATAPTFVRGSGRISFSLAKAGNVNLSVYNTSGRLVTNLVDGAMNAGNQTVTWDGADANGQQVARGTYFYRLTVDGKSSSAKAIVLE